MPAAIRQPSYQGPFGNIVGDPKLYEALARRSDDHLEQLLDQALEATFPASDPIAVTPASRTPQ